MRSEVFVFSALKLVWNVDKGTKLFLSIWPRYLKFCAKSLMCMLRSRKSGMCFCWDFRNQNYDYSKPVRINRPNKRIKHADYLQLSKPVWWLGDIGTKEKNLTFFIWPLLFFKLIQWIPVGKYITLSFRPIIKDHERFVTFQLCQVLDALLMII